MVSSSSVCASAGLYPANTDAAARKSLVNQTKWPEMVVVAERHPGLELFSPVWVHPQV
jgi:hypothetical protein